MMATCFYLLADEMPTNDVNYSVEIQASSLSSNLSLEDEQMYGCWMISVERDGNESWYNLSLDIGGDYTTLVDLIVAECGSQAHLYFCCNGQKYEAPTEDAPIILGYARKNMLVPYNPSTHSKPYCYTTDAGYRYLLGLNVVHNEDTWEIEGYCVLSARGSAVGQPAMKGDVDLDFSVGINDVTSLIDYLMNHSIRIDKGNADVDDDGIISISDVTALIDLLLGN